MEDRLSANRDNWMRGPRTLADGQGDLVVMMHCAKCDAVFEVGEGPAGTVCPRCGAVAAPDAPTLTVVTTAPAAPITPNHGEADFWFDDGSSKGGMALKGRPGTLRWTKNVAVRLTHSVCPHCGRKIARGSQACAYCGQMLKRSSGGSSDLGAALKKMLLAAMLVIGLPAALIVFVLVVCAPQGGDVQKAPKGSPPAAAKGGGAVQSGGQPASGEEAKPRRTPLSVLRSLRDKLRGTEHDGGSVPAKSSLEKTSDGTAKANVPVVGSGNGNQVKPDSAR